MLERMGEGSDGLAAVFPAMLNSLIALRTLGYSTSIRSTPRRRRISADCSSTIRKISGSAMSLARLGHRDHDHRTRGIRCCPGTSALRKAAGWLANKEVRIRGDWAVNNPHPEASGWAFEYNNVYYPDTDDTAMVLMALAAGPTGEPEALGELFRRRSDGSLSFQCRDGGWAAFDKDVTTPLARRHAVCRS